MVFPYRHQLLSARDLIDRQIEMLEKSALEHDDAAAKQESEAAKLRSGAAEIRQHIADLRLAVISKAEPRQDY